MKIHISSETPTLLNLYILSKGKNPKNVITSAQEYKGEHY